MTLSDAHSSSEYVENGVRVSPRISSTLKCGTARPIYGSRISQSDYFTRTAGRSGESYDQSGSAVCGKALHRRQVSCPGRRTAERRDRYEKIAARERKLVLDTLRQAGLVYVRVEQWDESPDGSVFEIEPLGQASRREDVINQIRTQIYPPNFFAEHLRDRLANFIGQCVKQVDRVYRTTLGFPVH